MSTIYNVFWWVGGERDVSDNDEEFRDLILSTYLYSLTFYFLIYF